MNTIEKGRLAEAKVVAQLVELGYEVYLPFGGNTSCDLIALRTGVLKRVEIKFTSDRTGPDSFEVSLRQIRPNRSGNKVKKFDATQADILAIFVVDTNDVILFEDTTSLHGRSSITVHPWKNGRAD